MSSKAGGSFSQEVTSNRAGSDDLQDRKLTKVTGSSSINKVCTTCSTFEIASFPGFTLVLRPIATQNEVKPGIFHHVT